MIFSRPSWDRNIPFSEIAARCQVPPEQVEWVVMKALSLSLIKGKMDQVDQNIKVTWVMPRVLTGGQMKEVGARVEQWMERVKLYEGIVGEGAVEIMN